MPEDLSLLISIAHEMAITARARGRFDFACAYDSMADAAERMPNAGSSAISYEPAHAESGG